MDLLAKAAFTTVDLDRQSNSRSRYTLPTTSLTKKARRLAAAANHELPGVPGCPGEATKRVTPHRRSSGGTHQATPKGA